MKSFKCSPYRPVLLHSTAGFSNRNLKAKLKTKIKTATFTKLRQRLNAMPAFELKQAIKGPNDDLSTPLSA